MNSLPFPHPRLADLKFVGIHGFIGDGKTTLYEAIKGLGLRCHDLSLADPLKICTHAIFGGEKRNYWGTQADKIEATPYWEARLGEEKGPRFANYRRIMQSFGDELRAMICPDIWVYAAEVKMLEGLDAGRILPGDTIVFPDVRYDNEAKACRMFGGLTIRIENLNRVPPPPTEANANSEKGLKDPSLIDVHYRCASLGELYQAAIDIIKRLDAPCSSSLTPTSSMQTS